MSLEFIERCAGIPTSIVVSVAFVYLVLKLGSTLPRILSDLKIVIGNNTSAMQNIRDGQKETAQEIKSLVTRVAVIDSRQQSAEKQLTDLRACVDDINENMATKSEFQGVQQTLSMLQGRLTR